MANTLLIDESKKITIHTIHLYKNLFASDPVLYFQISTLFFVNNE
jgi:hypothetical protein